MEKKKNEKEPLVSIITPMYNAEKYIEETIISVKNQTYSNWEMIIIDDYSTDEGYEKALKYSLDDVRIKVLKNKENLGVSQTRNKAIKNSKGKYIAFLDADDIWVSFKLEEQIKFMKDKKASISYTGYQKINKDSKIRGEIKVPNKLDYHNLLKACLMGCLTVVYDTEKIGKKYFKDLKKAEDYVLWLEILKEGNIAHGLQKSLAQYRVMNISRSSNKIKVVKFHWKIYREIEKLNFIKSVYYFINYLWYGYKRYKV